jgi:hypothetical protein
MLPPTGSEAEESTLRLLYSIFCTNALYKRKQKLYRTYKRLVTDHVWTEIETIQWILLQTLSSRRGLGKHYSITTN